jgi:HEAT repeat protein
VLRLREKQIFLEDPSKEVRASAVISLGELGVKEAIDAILDMLPREEERWVKIQIAHTLRRIGGRNIVPELIEMLLDEDGEVKLAVSRALLAITNRSFGTDYDKWLRWYKRTKGLK